MTDPKRPRDPDPLADDAFDAALGARLRAGREDTATLSAAVLSRLAQDPRQTPPGRWLTPAPMAAGFAGLMTVAGVAGYLWVPLFGAGGEDAILAAALGGLVPGGF
ncbi:MAG: hypothetical protein KDE00_00865 [Rhodobacteraceae bacterium]|nr:hypothetical protein [Paracoccaceae bacterium]